MAVRQKTTSNNNLPDKTNLSQLINLTKKIPITESQLAKYA